MLILERGNLMSYTNNQNVNVVVIILVIIIRRTRDFMTRKFWLG